MKRSYLSKRYKEMEPYVPGEQLHDKKYIKLNTNEAAYPPSLKARAVLTENVISSLNLYNDPDNKLIVDALAKFYRVDPEQVFVGNGSDEVLAFCFLAFIDQESPVCFPDITYGYYRSYAKSFGLSWREIPLREDFTIDVGDYLNCGGSIIIANPNAPTGIALSNDEIEKILRNNQDHVVIIDEAYVDYGSESAIELLGKYPNLIVVQTFSKSRNLAGARIGYAVSSPEIIADINNVKFSFSPYNVNSLALLAGAEAVNDADYFFECNRKIISTRERTKKELLNLGFSAFESAANFLFVSSNKIGGADYYRKLREEGILTRHYSNPRIENFVRITIGTDEQMDEVIRVTKKILAEGGAENEG